MAAAVWAMQEAALEGLTSPIQANSCDLHILDSVQDSQQVARQPKAPLENIVAMHLLELVHLNYLCLEPGNGLEENVLVVTDHFT